MYRASVPSWRVHRTLALQTSARLPKEVVKGLLRGVVEPDIAADRKVVCRRRRCRVVNVRHHAGVPWDLVKYYFNLACFYRARGDLYMAGVALGRAMHYIHDGAVKATGDAHDEIEKEMDELVKKLPDLCRNELAKRTNKAAEALCTAYLKSVQLVEWFAAEPQPPRKEALKALWRGRAKRWWPAAVFAMVFTSPLVVPPIAFFVGFLFALFWFLAVWTWMPEEYVVAMRGGAACVKPRGYLPAITC
jgi:hypothetical protein